MNARDVPPWLTHLRRDRRGIPVPTINTWGHESDVTRWRIAHDSHVGRPGVYFDDDPDAPPDFTHQNPGRQREAVLDGRCQVCWRDVPWSRRRLVIADLSVSWIDLPAAPGRQVPVVTEPWLCERCATFAVRVCPALIRRTRDEHLTVVEVTSRRDVEIVISHGWIEGPLEEESRRVQPAMWVKILLLRHRIERAR